MKFLQLLLQLILLLTGYYGEGRKHFGGGKLEVGDERFERQLHCKCTRFKCTRFTCFTRTRVQILTQIGSFTESAYVSIRQHVSVYLSVGFERQIHCKGTRFTCFTCTKVQILTQIALQILTQIGFQRQLHCVSIGEHTSASVSIRQHCSRLCF